MNEQTLEIHTESDIVAARQAGRDMARELGLGSADQTRLATAISELTRNVVQHAGSGVCTIMDASQTGGTGVRVVVEDHGPGIADIRQAMEPGFSTGRGLGAGLPGTKRLVQEFEIDSQPGHTKVTVAILRRRAWRRGPGPRSAAPMASGPRSRH